MLDIALVAAVSAAAYAAERWEDAAGLATVGEDARGVSAVFAGMTTAVVLVFVRGGSWRDLGFIRPDRWWTVPFWVAGVLAAYIGAQALAVALVSPFAAVPEPDLSRYQYVQGNLRAAATMALVLPISAAIPEEVIYRGFLMNRLTQTFGTGRTAAAATVVVQAILFGSVHFQWGFGGMAVTTIMGLVWGSAFLLCGRNLWIMIIAHSTGHVALVAQLYLATPTA